MPEEKVIPVHLPKSLLPKLSAAFREVEELWLNNIECKNPVMMAERSKLGLVKIIDRCISDIDGALKRRKARIHFNKRTIIECLKCSQKNQPIARACANTLMDHGVITAKIQGRVTTITLAEASDPIETFTLRDNAGWLARRNEQTAKHEYKKSHNRDNDAWIRADYYDMSFPIVTQKNRVNEAHEEHSMLSNACALAMDRDRNQIELETAEAEGLLWKYNAECIQRKSRYHSFWTYMSRQSRSDAYDIRTGQTLVAIDIVNAQPALIGFWIALQHASTWSQDWYTGAERSAIDHKNWDKQFADYRRCCYGDLYSVIATAANMSRDEVKSEIMWLMFRDPRFEPGTDHRERIMRAFKRRWPLVAEVIEINNRRMAIRYGKDRLSWYGRKFETVVMNRVIAKLREIYKVDSSIAWFTVHDCIFVTQQHWRTVLDLANNVGAPMMIRFSATDNATGKQLRVQKPRQTRAA